MKAKLREENWTLMWRTPSNWKHFISISARIFSGCGVILLLIFLIKASLISSDTAGTTLVTCAMKEILVINREYDKDFNEQ
jgi:hypothetical protein